MGKIKLVLSLFIAILALSMNAQRNANDGISLAQKGELTFNEPSIKGNMLNIAITNTKGTYKIINSKGQVLLFGTLTSQYINVEKLVLGVYFIEVKTEGKVTEVKQFVVE